MTTAIGISPSNIIDQAIPEKSHDIARLARKHGTTRFDELDEQKGADCRRQGNEYHGNFKPPGRDTQGDKIVENTKVHPSKKRAPARLENATTDKVSASSGFRAAIIRSSKA